MSIYYKKKLFSELQKHNLFAEEQEDIKTACEKIVKADHGFSENEQYKRFCDLFKESKFNYLNFKINLDNLSEYLSTFDESLLKEDMLQLEYKNYIIDFGFYSNKFILYIIEDYNWENPIKKEYINNINNINSIINKYCDDIVNYNI